MEDSRLVAKTSRFCDGGELLIIGGDQGQNPDADFAVLGNGIPDLELGWSNNITIGDWNINAFFRGAFGHSLVNSFRAFYEPRVATQGSYNLVNTSLANNDLTQPQFSSLYVEKADFLKLDNLTVSRKIDTNLLLELMRLPYHFLVRTYS